jgi:hypothetical protein
MNFATFALMFCLVGANDICYGPYPSGEVFPYDALKTTPQGVHPAYAQCRERANELVRQGDALLKSQGLEVFVYQPTLACKTAPGGSGRNGATTHAWGQGA